jgi:cyclohexanone monooxygenase
LRRNGVGSIEATPEAEESWVRHVNEMAGKTLYPHCNSWYLGANIPGKTRVFMPLIGFPAYVDTCANVAACDYEGFVLSPAGGGTAGNVMAGRATAGRVAAPAAAGGDQ